MNSSAALDQAAQTFAELPRLTAVEARVRLHAIAEALPSCDSPERLTAIASALPRRVAEFAPEVGLALAELALTLAHHHPRLPDDLDRLGPRVRVAWLRVQLTTHDGSAPLDGLDETLLDGLDETLVVRALNGWSIVDVANPGPQIEAMSRAADPRLRAAVFEQLQPALQHLALTLDQACACLLRLAEDREPSLRRAAFAGLSRYPATRLAPGLRAARDRLVQAGLDDDDDAIATTCMALADREALVEIAFDEHRTGARRVAAIASLGPLAHDEDLEPVLALANHDPLRFGACALTFVLAAHRRGVFVRAAQIPALLAAFDGHQGWTGELVARVTHIVRTELVAALAELPADDRRWIRRASILAASTDARAHEQLAALLRATTDLRIAIALVDAAGRSPDFDDERAEQALLAWLDPIPESVIPVLAVKGSDAAALRLRTLVEDPRTPTSAREPALAALWALSRDRGPLLRELCERLGPHVAGLLNPARLSGRDSLPAAILIAAAWPKIPAHAIDPLAAFGLLCESGELRCLPEVTRRFRALFEGYVGEALAGDFTIKRVRLPELEQQLYRYGRHLIADGRHVRRWIEAGPDTGRELVLAVAIAWLREQPAAPLCVALLETVARHEPSGASLRRIEAFWRHRDPEVQRAAIEALVAAGERARGLELSIGRLTSAADPRIASRALEAVASLAASWAEPMVVAALARPEMAIKKAAAAALAVIGTLRCVPVLVEWLGIHDNAAFRTSLLAALRVAAGASAMAVLVDAFEGAGERRSKLLLREALSGMLTLRACSRLARSREPGRIELVEAAIRGELRLADASPERLASLLHRAKLRTLPETEDPTRRLRLEGFSADAALAVLELRDDARKPALLQVVRASLAEWLRWLASEDKPAGESYFVALALTLEAATSAHAEHFEALLTLAEPTLAQLEPRIVADFLERCLVDAKLPVAPRARGLAMLRALPIAADVGGLRRFTLLGKLGAVRGRADLDRCLAECRVGPQLAGESERLLMMAFAIPSPSTDELRQLGKTAVDELEALRERCKTWYRASPAEADAWLSATLASRPLDLPALGFPPRPEHERPKPICGPSTGEDLESLLAIVRGDADRPSRERAAEQILGWHDARTVADSWKVVLDRYLAGEIHLSRAAKADLATVLEHWPDTTSPAVQARAWALSNWLDREQRKRFLPSWIAAWERGDPDIAESLRSIDPDLLIPIVRARAVLGDYASLRLLRPNASLALRELIEFVRARAPDEVAHLLPAPAPSEPAPTLDDPLADEQPDELVTLLGQRSPPVAIGLAVRAIHALAKFEDRGADAIEPFTLDRRPQVRSAALRALKKLVPKPRSLQATVAVLEIEDRRDVIASLLAAIGHARYRPGLPRLLAVLIDPDPKLREAAENALRAWGSEVVPELVRAARKARPDRRRIFEQLIATLELPQD